MAESAVVKAARSLFLDEGHVHGCAETAFVVLKGAYCLDDPTDASAAMALNGGVAYSGGACGAITGAALAIGILAERRIDDHRRAKTIARRMVAALMDEFGAAHGAVDCRALVGYDLRAPGGHAAFMASGIWRDRCMRQIEFVVARMAALADEVAWAEAVRTAEAAEV